MSKTFKNKNPEFVYFNTKYGNTIPKRPIGKINVVNAKLITDTINDASDCPKDKTNIPTPRDVVNDYLESTSVHGLQYLGKTEVEVGTRGKILWTFVIITCFACLSLMVIQFLRRYNENPTNTYIKTFDIPIYQAPFPAVTICPVTPVSMRRRLAILENAILPENVTKHFALNLMKYGHHITHPYTKPFKYMDKLKAFLDANRWSVSEFLKILIPCDDIFESCWWSTERIDCSKAITTSHSSYGLCCSFNYRLEDYIGSQKEQPKLKPLSSADFGRWSGLKLVINNEMLVDDEIDAYDILKLTNSNGIVVLIHHSMDFPGLNTDMFVLQPDHELEIAIDPQLIQKPQGVQHRNKENELVSVCVAEDENTLKYFPVYRSMNCYADCRIRAMLKICGCLPFIFIPISELYNVKLCEIDHLSCIQGNMKFLSIVKDTKNENFTCSCRSPCEDVNYDGYPNAISLMKTSSSNVSETTAVVKVFMYSQSFQNLITLPAADATYLLASIGGIFSLFLGCSFLSLVEIVYFTYLFCRAIYARTKAKVQTKQTRNENFVNDRRRVY